MQVITTPAKKGKVVKMVATQRRNEPSRNQGRRKIARQMKLF